MEIPGALKPRGELWRLMDRSRPRALVALHRLCLAFPDRKKLKERD